MKRLLFLLFFLLFPIYGYCASIVNVEYIHQAIKQKWNVDIPYSAELENPKIAANMKYLLTMIDRANARLNGFETTTYGDNATYATLAAADTIATDAAVQDLIKAVEIDYSFSFTNNSTDNRFEFYISAAGTFYVDWGDGTVERYVKTNTYSRTISHTYSDAASNYKIRLGGRATKYGTDSVVWFGQNSTCYLKSMEGSLGEIFPYGENLNFAYTFGSCDYLSDIPENLFAGIKGVPTQNMFSRTFASCSGLTSIPENLFAGIQGAPAKNVFRETFTSCEGLTSIPENLFAGIQGAPAQSMFESTFENCSGLTGSIPANLFAGIRGAPAQSMFENTFWGCRGLTGSIPENLFAGIRGAPAERMFQYTFRDCRNLTNISGNLFAGIRGAPAQSMFYGTFYECSGLTGSIPENLFGDIKGAPVYSMFSVTFFGCSGLTGSIPENLFGDISGPAQYRMFDETFYLCSGLTGPSARINGEYLYNIWPNNISDMSYMYVGARGVSDYSEIPAGMK